MRDWIDQWRRGLIPGRTPGASLRRTAGGTAEPRDLNVGSNLADPGGATLMLALVTLASQVKGAASASEVATYSAPAVTPAVWVPSWKLELGVFELLEPSGQAFGVVGGRLGSRSAGRRYPLRPCRRPDLRPTTDRRLTARPI